MRRWKGLVETSLLLGEVTGGMGAGEDDSLDWLSFLKKGFLVSVSALGCAGGARGGLLTGGVGWCGGAGGMDVGADLGDTGSRDRTWLLVGVVSCGVIPCGPSSSDESSSSRFSSCNWSCRSLSFAASSSAR